MALAMKINIVLHYWAGFIGMHLLLARVIGLRSRPMVFFLATLFTASGAPAIHFLRRTQRVPAGVLPAAGCSTSSSDRWRPRTLHGALLGRRRDCADGLQRRHAHPADGDRRGRTARCRVGGDAPRLAAAGGGIACAVVAGLAYSAPKLVPVVSFVTGTEFWDTRPPMARPDRTTLEMLERIYLDPHQTRAPRLPEQRHGWHEYGNYIGEFGALLIIAGLFWTLTARGTPEFSLGLPLAIATLVFFVWSLGEFSVFAPAAIATHLPLFSSFRIPSRYSMAFVLCGAATAGWALRAVGLDALTSRRTRAFVAVICIAASAHLIARNRELLVNVFSQPPLTTNFKPLAGPRQLVTDSESNPYKDGSPMFTALMNDRSFYSCYESLQLRHTATAEHPARLLRRAGTDRRDRRSHPIASSSRRLVAARRRGFRSTRITRAGGAALRGRSRRRPRPWAA